MRRKSKNYTKNYLSPELLFSIPFAYYNILRDAAVGEHSCSIALMGIRQDPLSVPQALGQQRETIGLGGPCRKAVLVW